MKLSNSELCEIVGGVNLTASMISAIGSLFSKLFEIGENLGSAIYRITKKHFC